MRARLPSLVAALVGMLAGPLSAQVAPAPRSDPFELTLATEVGLPRGYVQVRENAVQGTHLSLHGDLGIDTVERVTVGAAYRLNDNARLRLAFDTIFLYGTERLDSDVFFNGARLQGGTDLQSRPEFSRLTALYERRLVDLAGGGGIAADIGLTYVFLTYEMHGTLLRSARAARPRRTFLRRNCPCRCSACRSITRSRGAAVSSARCSAVICRK